MELHHRLRLRRPGPYLLDHESKAGPSRNRTSYLLRVMQALDRGAPGPFFEKRKSPARGSNPATPRYEGGASPLMLGGQVVPQDRSGALAG